MKLLEELIIIIALSLQVVLVNSERCTTTCGIGKYCNDDDCLPCPPKTYQNLTRHREAFCKHWTSMTDYGWVIKRNGSATEDVQWKCGDQYKMVEYSPGSYECRDNITSSSSSTTTTQSANLVTTSPIGPTQTRATAPDDKTSPPGDDHKLLSILVPILSIIAIGAAAIIFLRCKNLYCFSKIHEPNREASTLPLLNGNRQDQLDTSGIASELYILFDMAVSFIGLGNCHRLLIELQVSITHNGPQKRKEDYIYDLQCWAKSKPDLDHPRSIRTSLDNIGFKLPPEPEPMRSTVVDIDRQSEGDIERQNEEYIERQNEGDIKKQNEGDIKRQNKGDIERQNEVDIERQNEGYIKRQNEEDIERQTEEVIARLQNKDIASLVRSIKKAERLNNAFERFCLGMVKDLGTNDGESILGNLNLTKVMEFKNAEKKDYEIAFCNTLLQWSHSHACIQSDNGNQWLPLDMLKDTLRKIERNDMVEKMENSTHKKYNDSELKDIIRNYFNAEKTVL